jgi:hypothetical protein
VLVLAAAALAAGVEDARACSCALPDAREALARADGAFIGTLESRRESGQQAVLVFDVERVLKGSIGGFVTVHTPANSAACGIEVAAGARVGLVLDRIGGAWHGVLCGQFEPAELLAAARPLPAPTGRGPVALVVAGEFGEARLLTLDARGRTLAYGRGDGRTGLVSVCPGRGLLAELAYLSSGSTVLIRNARTLRVVRRQSLRLPGQRFAQRLHCVDPGGTQVVVFARRPAGDAPEGSALYRAQRRGVTAIWRGAALDAAFTTSHAFLSAGSRGVSLVRVALGTGRARRLATLPIPTATLAVDRSGGLVAGVGVPSGRGSDVVRVDLRGARPLVVTARLPSDEGAAQVFWLASGRLLFVPTYGSSARVLDDSLRTQSRFRWRALGAAVAGVRLYGTDLSLTLYRAALPSGPQVTVRRLPGRAHFIVSATR